METDYIRHDAVYRLRGKESLGWNSPAVDAEVLGYADRLLFLAGLKPPASVLELGCGMGNLSLPLARCGFAVTGIDISPFAVKEAARRAAAEGLTGASFAVADVTEAEVWARLEYFDCILDGLLFHCVIGEHRLPLLRNVRARLKPGGCFVLMTMCGDPVANELALRFDPATRCIVDGAVAERYLGSPRDLLAEATEAGFDIAAARVAQGDQAGDQPMLLAVCVPTASPSSAPAV